uniref:Uncharacterized protein n=1 Tax=Meloidogyne enterolobii TaxID=390850 RepID=A0A6V7XAN6_MELEN|nr:unnamed protein product [Meloidogyne enterolobii]
MSAFACSFIKKYIQNEYIELHNYLASLNCTSEPFLLKTADFLYYPKS